MVENIMAGDWVQFLAEGKLTQMRVVGIEDNGSFIQTYMEHYINYRLPDNLFIEAPEGMYNIKN